MTSSGGTGADGTAPRDRLSCRPAEDLTMPSRGTAAAAATTVLSPARLLGPLLTVMCSPSSRESG
ncbi:hypothetical protein GCM10010269_66240 [Streptomyces humidus]|uniref:Uncharacterized protein n=1 Tax=Streptomyces humidus TaxID=52259 RepID=A0A918G422_9ACTN|nr:hypothetical protein GCM10010269_66240 [Streptomyces humidus]